MKKIIIISMLILTIFTVACTYIPEQEVTNFEECVKAGNEVKIRKMTYIK